MQKVLAVVAVVIVVVAVVIFFFRGKSSSGNGLTDDQAIVDVVAERGAPTLLAYAMRDCKALHVEDLQLEVFLKIETNDNGFKVLESKVEKPAKDPAVSECIVPGLVGKSWAGQAMASDRIYEVSVTLKVPQVASNN